MVLVVQFHQMRHNSHTSSTKVREMDFLDADRTVILCRNVSTLVYPVGYFALLHRYLNGTVIEEISVSLEG